MCAINVSVLDYNTSMVLDVTDVKVTKVRHFNTENLILTRAIIDTKTNWRQAICTTYKTET